MSDKDLRKKVIKLAYDKPELREHLLPVIKEANIDDQLDTQKMLEDMSDSSGRMEGGAAIYNWGVDDYDGYSAYLAIPIGVMPDDRSAFIRHINRMGTLHIVKNAFLYDIEHDSQLGPIALIRVRRPKRRDIETLLKEGMVKMVRKLAEEY